jgi:hypothetical protein
MMMNLVLGFTRIGVASDEKELGAWTCGVTQRHLNDDPI